MAVPVDRARHGRAARLRRQSPTPVSPGKIPGAAFIASIAYSAYLIQKLVIHFVAQFCASHDIALTSAAALIGVEICVYAAATILFLAVERPFLQLRQRVAGRD
jgi:peptidoglycan/LPS O-acetylase OafA/YrhL